MTRRAFLALSAAVTATAAGVVAIADGVRPESLRAHLRRFEGFGRQPLDRLRAHYNWLNVDPAAFDEYLANYQRYFGRLSRFSVPRTDFYVRFLLCTDFFSSVAADPDHKEPVRYAGFYLPTQSACFNPLAQPPPSDAELAASTAHSRN